MSDHRLDACCAIDHAGQAPLGKHCQRCLVHLCCVQRVTHINGGFETLKEERLAAIKYVNCTHSALMRFSAILQLGTV
jgi:hypothetical protein